MEVQYFQKCHPKTLKMYQVLLDKLSKECLEALSLPSESISRIIIANDDMYGDAIKSVDINGTFTNTNDAVGQAQVIYNYQTGKLCKNTILFRESIILNIIEELINNDCEYGRYINIFHHEFGHCKDHYLRPVNNRNELKLPCSLHDMSTYFIESLLDEFAAESHAAVMAQETAEQSLLHELKFHQNHLAESLDDISKKNYASVDLKIYDIAQLFWTILQLASQTISMEIQRNTIIIQNDNRDIIIIEKLRNSLKKLWRIYPNWNTNICTQELMPIWKELTEDYGVLFSEEAGRIMVKLA